MSGAIDDNEQEALVRWGWDAGWQAVLAQEASTASPSAGAPSAGAPSAGASGAGASGAGASDAGAPSDVARVVVGHRGEVDVARGDTVERAALSPALRRIATPIVGDFVRLGGRGARGLREVVHVLPRRTELVRKAAGRATGAQAIGANVDVVMLATALVFDLNVRRLERFLALVAQSGARPVVVLTKADLVTPESAEATARQVRGVLGDAVPVHVTSVQSGTGLDALEPYFARQRTVALLGSSGVGKSTLLNAWLAPDDAHAVGDLRGDGRGRHTTTRRELVVRPHGGLVLDTPGVREVGLWLDRDESALDDTFPEVAEVATQCRFTNCAHVGEPGCAVAAAMDRGTLDAARVRSYLALRSETRETAERRQQKPRGRR